MLQKGQNGGWMHYSDDQIELDKSNVGKNCQMAMKSHLALNIHLEQTLGKPSVAT